jgi:UDP-N-acetylmuramoyl-tripeptide--D-alanyl-D-alanine ligase
MPVLTAAEIAEICSGRLVGDGATSVPSLVGDSREVSEGDGFVAIRGGRDFVGEAFAAGARLAVVEHADLVPDGATGVVVTDVVATLARLSAEVRSRLRARVVGITGSTGKTLTKDFTAAALGSRWRVHASPRSFNTEVGVPLAVLSCPDDAEVLVVELGARHAGEIAELTAIVRPEIGVVTGIGKTHLGEFGSREAIARTKAELLSALPPAGLAVVPADDEFLPLLASSTMARLIAVGPGGHVRFDGDRVELLRGDADDRPSGRTVGSVSVGTSLVSVTLPVAGRALMRNAAVALSIAAELGVDLEDAARAIERTRPSSWRMEVSSIGGWTLVNDAYNANPVSTGSALRTVRELAGTTRPWAVLGEMAELGPVADAEHARMGRLAVELGYEGVIVVGTAAEALARSAAPIGIHVTSMAEAADAVVEHVPPYAYLLVKGSLVTGLKDFGAVLTERLAHTPSRTT